MKQPLRETDKPEFPGGRRCANERGEQEEGERESKVARRKPDAESPPPLNTASTALP